MLARDEVPQGAQNLLRLLYLGAPGGGHRNARFWRRLLAPVLVSFLSRPRMVSLRLQVPVSFSLVMCINVLPPGIPGNSHG